MRGGDRRRASSALEERVLVSFLRLADIDFDVFRLTGLTDDHTGVNLFTGSDKQCTALLCIEQTVGDGLACLECDQGALLAVLDIALVRRIAVKYSVHDTVALGVGHELTTVSDQTAGQESGIPGGSCRCGRGSCSDQFALSLAELFDNVSGKLFRNIDIYLLHRLELVTLFIIMVQNLRLADCKLIALTAHVLDQDGQMQLAASGYLKAIGGICFFHAKANVSI